MSVPTPGPGSTVQSRTWSSAMVPTNGRGRARRGSRPTHAGGYHRRPTSSTSVISSTADVGPVGVTSRLRQSLATRSDEARPARDGLSTRLDARGVDCGVDEIAEVTGSDSRSRRHHQTLWGTRLPRREGDQRRNHRVGSPGSPGAGGVRSAVTRAGAHRAVALPSWFTPALIGGHHDDIDRTDLVGQVRTPWTNHPGTPLEQINLVRGGLSDELGSCDGPSRRPRMGPARGAAAAAAPLLV